MKITKNAIVCSFVCLGSTLYAQETVTTTGGEATGAGGTSSYTIGQVNYSSETGSAGTVTQGVQQPYEIYISAGVEEVEGISLEVSTFPNPVIDFLVLKIENYSTENFTYQLYDEAGKLIENQKVKGGETNINMADYLPAVYFLKVYTGKNNQELKSFKIIKN